ncbi:MAG: hypothetical protein VB144_14185 [Clostridia bacterium]|nr:hypothetical protein [Clostridia bacterium]
MPCSMAAFRHAIVLAVAAAAAAAVLALMPSLPAQAASGPLAGSAVLGEREYVNREYGFAFRYPDGWGRLADEYCVPRSVVSIGDGRTSAFGPRVNVIVDPTSAASARAYAQAVADKIGSGQVAGLSDYKADGSGMPGAVKGADSWVARFSCRSADAGDRVWFYQLTVVRRADVIVLTAACLESERGKRSQLCSDIASSFRLI